MTTGGYVSQSGPMIVEKLKGPNFSPVFQVMSVGGWIHTRHGTRFLGGIQSLDVQLVMEQILSRISSIANGLGRSSSNLP